MTKKAAVPDELERGEEAPDAPKKEREREITPAPTVGGVFDEDGTCLQAGGLPEPDDHRMKKPER